MATGTVVAGAPALSRLTGELFERVATAVAGRTPVAVVGVRRGGLALASRLVRFLQVREITADSGEVDIALYRDDAHLSWPQTAAGATRLPFSMDGRDVVLVDDVFWTGRTARAAMDAVLDYGRPRRLWLATLVVRDGRELPLAPDFFALEVSAGPQERVELRLVEDGHAQDELVVVPRGTG